MKKLALLFSLIFGVCLLSYSANIEWKSGYVVTLTGDTIHGFIAYQFEQKQGDCLFRSDNKGKSITYTPEELRMYMYDSGLRYESLEINNPRVKGTFFVECLLKGQLSLYYANISADSSYVRYIVINEVNKKRIELKPVEEYSLRSIGLAQNKKMLEIILAGYPDLKDELKKMKGNREHFIQLFENYNDWLCNEERCIVYTEPARSRHFWITPSVGVQLNMIDYLDLYRHSIYRTQVSPTVGTVFSMNIDKFSGMWLFNVGVNASMLKIDEINRGQSFKFNSYNIQSYFTVECRWINKVNPSCEAGIFQMGTINTDNKIELFESSQNYEFGYRKYTFGILWGVGIALPVGKHNLIPVKIQYSKPLLGKLIFNRFIESDMLSLSVGYTFFLK